MIARFMVLLLACSMGARADAPRKAILCLGDSLTAGYGLSADKAWPALLQQKLDAAGLPYDVVNAGVSGDTTAGGLRRIDWLLRRPYDVVILALGANDGLRGVPVAETEKNIEGIVAKVRAHHPAARILLAGMQVPPNMGPDYAASFGAVFPALARRNDAALWPFLLDGVAGRPELNLDDGIHPNAEGHRVIAERAWAILRPLL